MQKGSKGSRTIGQGKAVVRKYREHREEEEGICKAEEVSMEKELSVFSLDEFS